MALIKPTMYGASYDSDTSVTVWFKYNASEYPWALSVERRTDGGQWVEVKSQLGAALPSYTDTGVSANHRYEYRLRAWNSYPSKVYGPYSNVSNAVCTTPAAPGSLQAVFTSANQVALSWTDTSPSEQLTYIYRAPSSTGVFELVDTVTSANVTSYTDTAAPAGNPAYRIAYGATSLYTADGQLWVDRSVMSAYSAAVTVKTLAKPNPPTLISPANGAVLDMPSMVRVTWQHNPTDGTAQTGAEVKVRYPTGNTVQMSISNSNNYALVGTSSVAVNGAVVWSVQTYGTDPTPSDWSPTQTFYVKQSPTAAITGPVAVDGDPITDVPVTVSFDYSDNSGDFQSAAFTITDAAGNVAYADNAPSWAASGGGYSVSIPPAAFLPANNSTYTVTLSVNSTSGLSSVAERTFTTDYEEPDEPAVSYSIDTASASVTVTVDAGTGGSSVATESVGLFRIDERGQEAISAVMPIGSTVTDYLPPLDQDYQYKAVAYTSNGLTSQTLVTVNVDSGGASFFNWGDANAECASFGMDNAWSIKVDPVRSLFEVIGAQDPVVRTTSRRTKTMTATGTVWWDDDAQLEALQNIPGRVWFREPRGHVVPVALTVSLTFPKGVPTTSASVSMTQITTGA